MKHLINGAIERLIFWTESGAYISHSPNVELTGAARLYRAASRERSERG